GAAEVAGVGEAAAGGRQLGHEDVAGAAVARLVGGRRGEVARLGVAGHVGGAGGVHGDGLAGVVAAAPEVGREDEGIPGGGELGHEGVGAGGQGGLVGPGRGREVGRGGAAGDVGTAGGVHGHGVGLVPAAAAEVGREEQPAGGAELADEGVGGA